MENRSGWTCVYTVAFWERARVRADLGIHTCIQQRLIFLVLSLIVSDDSLQETSAMIRSSPTHNACTRQPV